jgi:hypothetical protein
VHRLQLLNSTVAQLAKSVNQVLTKVYQLLYSEGEEDGEDPPQLTLRTAPLAASEEVIALYGAQLLPCEHAVRAAMHTLGASPDQIDAAVEDLCAKEQKQQQVLDEDRERAKEEQKVGAEERRVNMDATRATTEVVKKEARGMVKATAASSSSDGSGGGGGSK